MVDNGSPLMKSSINPRRIGIIVLKTIGWIVLTVVILLIVLSFAIQIPAIQQRLLQKGVTFIHQKIGTPVSIGHISVKFPKKVVIEDVYFEDQSNDTLLYAGRLAVNTDLFALVNNRIQLNSVELKNLTANIERSSDSVFNFDYIIEAFTSDTTQQSDTTSAGWDFSLHNMDLQGINLSYQDSLEGTYIDLQLGTLDVEVDEFDLAESTIMVQDVLLADVNVHLIQTEKPEPDTTAVASEDTSAFPFNIGIGEVTLRNITAGYEQQASGMQITLNLGRSELIADEIALSEKLIALDKFLLEETFFTYHQLPSNRNDKMVERDTTAMTASTESETWKFTLDELTLNNNGFQYYDFNEKIISGSVDFNHMWVTDLDVAMEDIAYNEKDITATLNDFSFSEKSGFVLHTMKGVVTVTESSADLRDFVLQTGHSELHMTLHSEFPSLSDLSESYGMATVDASIRNSHLGWRDVLYFQPGISQSIPLTIPQDMEISMELNVSGRVNDLTLERLLISTLQDTRLITYGHLRGLPDVEQLRFNVQLDSFYTSRNDILTILPDTMLPASTQLPQRLTLGGRFSGTLEKPSVKAALLSSLGDIYVDAKLNLDSLSNSQGYNASLAVDQLETGKLLGQPDVMGPLTMEGSIKGTGTSMDNLKASLEATIHSFVYQKYSYEDFHIEGTVDRYLFSGDASMKDPNLDFNLEADVDYNKEIPTYKMALEVRNVDLQKLNFTQSPLQAKGTLTADFDNASIDNLNGSIDMRNVLIYSGKLYRVDSLLFASIDQDRNTEVSIQSDIVEGEFKGTIDIPSLPEVLQRHFASYYTLHDTTMDESMQPQNFSFRLQLKSTDLLTEVLVPQLKSFVPGEIRGDFNSENKELDITVNIEKVHYASVLAEGLNFSLMSDRRNLEYEFTANTIDAGPVRIPGLIIEGEVARDSIDASMVILDSLEEEKYALAGIFRSIENGYRFYFDPDRVLLNYNLWDVPEGNYIQFGNGNFQTHELSLRNGEQVISIRTPEDKDSTIAIAFRALDLNSLTNMITSGDTLLDGTLQGDIRIFKARAAGAMEASLSINDFSIQENPWGDLTLNVDQTSGGDYRLNLNVQGANNDMRVTGTYSPLDTGATLDMRARIESFAMASLEPLSFGQLRDTEGTFAGNLSIQGSVNDPDISGELRFKNTKFFVTYLQTRLTLPNEVLSLTPAGIRFNNFQVLDIRNNPLVIDGIIGTEAYNSFEFDLTVRADNFQLMNTTEEDNELFYGNVRLNTVTTIGGDSNLPVIDMRVDLGDESEFTYVVPQPESGVMEYEGIVRFVDKDVEEDPFLASLPDDTEITDTALAFTGIDLTANIELDDSELFHIVMDPMTGDRLSVRGNATLSLEMDRTGDMQLSGRYQLTEGSYNLTFYNLVKRELQIAEGSTIVWTGDPMDARLDITATYTVETSPLDLVSNQLTGSDQELINRYKQRIPFIVKLFIEGKLLSPEISFELDMPETERGALEGVPYARIRDINTRESELNKQVFALLILQRFISDNPFENQAAEGFESTARRSVSRILSDQLNKLSQNIEGVELNFDLRSYEDYSTGEAETTTQLQLGLSKNFLDERLVVRLAGNVNLEGGQTEQSNVTDYIGDLVLEYKLTEDGRFRVTGFRRSDYSMIDGQLIETGVGIIYVKDYDAFRELFRSNAKEEE